MATRRTSLADLQQQEAASKAALAKKKTALAVKQAELRHAEQQALNRRRFLVGKLVLDTALATLTLEQLQEALTWLAWCVEDKGRFQTWLRASREGAAPEFEPCSLPGISSEIPATATNGTKG